MMFDVLVDRKAWTRRYRSPAAASAAAWTFRIFESSRGCPASLTNTRSDSDLLAFNASADNSRRCSTRVFTIFSEMFTRREIPLLGEVRIPRQLDRLISMNPQ